MPEGRFAPSPTGDLHLGNLRTALLAWLFARTSGSAFRVRMEDLDTARVRPGSAEGQIADLRALGLDWDGPVEHQSVRAHLYARALDGLEAEGRVYPCFCTRAEIREAASAPHGPLPEGAYPGTCRTLSAAERAGRTAEGRLPALRFRASPLTAVTVTDRLLGEVSGHVDDFVLRRGDGTFAYNLAVVVDDAEQGIGEVVRGADLLESTPRQVVLARALGLPVAAYAHVPLVLGPDGSRLAKRHGAVTLRGVGARPPAVLSALAASVGLAAAREAVTPADLLDRFVPERLTTLSTTWDPAAPDPLGALARRC
ncbi:MAG: tRNA glutamyl-Q(34) synthetase GluQRS [Solirubrobacteraceae bacterium]